MYGYTEFVDAFRIRALYTAFREDIESDYFFSGERHNFWELVIALRGQIGVTAGEHAWVLQEGEAVLHPPMEFHRVWYTGSPGRILVFSFGAKGLPKGAGSSFRADLPKVEGLLNRTRECFQMEGIQIQGLRGENLEAQMILKEWELYLLGLMRQKKQRTQEAHTGPAKNYAAIVKILEDHIHEKLTIGDIARLCSMSPASVKQTFTRYAGLGIMAYFNRLKIDSAVELLRSGSSVQETAAALGFSSQNYFSTVFKRILGEPPTAYKL